MLKGLQRVYCDEELRSGVEAILEEEIEVGDKDNGRSGMPLWQILVLGLIRLQCNWDWDKVVYMANTHIQIRQMLGLGTICQDPAPRCQHRKKGFSFRH